MFYEIRVLGHGMTRLHSRHMEGRQQFEVLPARQTGIPFYDFPNTQIHQYHELEGPTSEHNHHTIVSSGNYTTMQPAGSVRDGSITPVANGTHTIYDDEPAVNEHVVPHNGIPRHVS